MKKTFLLASAVALAAFAGPTWAQSGPQYSTPAEQEQTRALNAQAIDGTTQSPAVLNGDEQASGSTQQQAQEYGNPQSPGYGAQPGANDQADQYGQQPMQQSPAQQQYDQQQQNYQDQRQRYESDRAQYRADLRAYDQAMYDWSYPAPIVYEYGDRRDLMRLYLIANPSEMLARLPVEGPDGRWVGRVRNVDIAPDGRPGRVEIALNRRVSVWVPAGDLRLDPDAHVVFTDLSRADLWQMPGATVESGPM